VIETAVLIIQKEVAERLMVPPGSADRGILTVMLEAYGSIEKIIDVPSSAFWPMPSVNSTIVRINSIKNPESGNTTPDGALFWFVKQGFAGKRKILSNSLAGSLRLPKDQVSAIVEKAGIDSLARAEDLTISDWQRLFEVYKQKIESSLSSDSRL
jgi:16S rRNA (adenine1518-N6/adenine1519-N6)-dimethyltransferase